MILPGELMFDVAIFADVLEHVRPTPRVLLEAARARLKPGGRVIASTGNETPAYSRLSLLSSVGSTTGPAPYARRDACQALHAARYVRALVESAGLRVTGVEVTSIPLLEIHGGFGRAPLSWLHRIGRLAARAWKRMFA